MSKRSIRYLYEPDVAIGESAAADGARDEQRVEIEIERAEALEERGDGRAPRHLGIVSA